MHQKPSAREALAAKFAALASPLPGTRLNTMFRASPHADPFHGTLHQDHAHATPYPGVATSRYGTRTGPNEWQTNLHEMSLTPGGAAALRVHPASNVGPSDAGGRPFHELLPLPGGNPHPDAHEAILPRDAVAGTVSHRVRMDGKGNVLSHEPLTAAHPPITKWTPPAVSAIP